MLNFVLYASPALIWGFTWLAIKFQLSQVPPILSEGYRMSGGESRFCGQAGRPQRA